MTFRKSLLWNCSLALLYFLKGRKSFLGFHRSQSQHKPRTPSEKFNMHDFYASTQAFIAKAGIVCEHWCSYIRTHRAPLCVLLTQVWKPGLRTLKKLQLFQGIKPHPQWWETIAFTTAPISLTWVDKMVAILYKMFWLLEKFSGSVYVNLLSHKQ